MSTNDSVLSMTLQVAVPLWIAQWKAKPATDRMARARICAQHIAEHGDVILFKGKGTAEAFNHLAEGLALLSFFPGGIDFAGTHWETKES